MSRTASLIIAHSHGNFDYEAQVAERLTYRRG